MGFHLPQKSTPSLRENNFHFHDAHIRSHISTFIHASVLALNIHTHTCACISMNFRKDAIGMLLFKNNTSLLVMLFLWMNNALFSLCDHHSLSSGMGCRQKPGFLLRLKSHV